MIKQKKADFKASQKLHLFFVKLCFERESREKMRSEMKGKLKTQTLFLCH